jgi:cytosine/adenosine deaminase-related metal-dependent hydrolase
MKTFVRCGQLFTGRDDEAIKNAALVYDEAGRVAYVGKEKGAPQRRSEDQVIDHSGHFVMPGLIDVHTHLAYGNAKTEEDIDLYSPLEFRALRGMFFAQKVAAAGYTAICSPGDAGQISLSIRDEGWTVRRSARHGGRALYHLAPGADRLVSDVDRRAGDLDR